MEPSLERSYELVAPTALKRIAEKTVKKAEGAFNYFMQAAHKSVDMIP